MALIGMIIFGLFTAACANETGIADPFAQPTDVATGLPTGETTDGAAPAGSPTGADTEGAETGESQTTEGASPMKPYDLGVRLERADGGFRLGLDESIQLRGLETYVSQPADGSDGSQHVLHLLLTYSEAAKGARVQGDAVVVHPDTEQAAVYTLFAANVPSGYDFSRFWRMNGWRDNGRFLYSAVVNEGEERDSHYHRAEELDITTGERRIVMPRLPEPGAGDDIGNLWLADAANKVLMYGYKEGVLWSLDLESGEARQTDSKLTSSWYLFDVNVSPDGERFWHIDQARNEYRLIDESGKELAQMPFSAGYTQYPHFQWSPDSRFSILLKTKDKRRSKPILQMKSEYNVHAMERIRVFDREGQSADVYEARSGHYMDAAGWLNEHVLLLERYEWNSEDGVMGEKKNVRFSLLDLETGQETELKLIKDAAALKSHQKAIKNARLNGDNRQLHVVDGQQALLWLAAENGDWVSPEKSERIGWTTQNDEGGYYYELDAATGKVLQADLDGRQLPVEYAGEEWFLDSNMEYTRIRSLLNGEE